MARSDYSITMTVDAGEHWTATARLTLGTRTWVGTSTWSEIHAVKRAYRAMRRSQRSAVDHRGVLS